MPGVTSCPGSTWNRARETCGRGRDGPGPGRRHLGGLFRVRSTHLVRCPDPTHSPGSAGLGGGGPRRGPPPVLRGCAPELAEGAWGTGPRSPWRSCLHRAARSRIAGYPAAECGARCDCARRSPEADETIAPDAFAAAGTSTRWCPGRTRARRVDRSGVSLTGRPLGAPGRRRMTGQRYLRTVPWRPFDLRRCAQILAVERCRGR
jgi:hypothetical protein